MTTAAPMSEAQRPSAGMACLGHFKVGGPMSRLNGDWGAQQSGWTAINTEYGSLSIKEKRLLNHASFGVKYVQSGQQPLRPFEPPPVRGPPNMQALAPNDMKRMHLIGNYGVISSPQPCTTDNVKSHLTVPPALPKPEPEMKLPKDVQLRKAFDLSSEIMQSPRMLQKSTSCPGKELYPETFGKFPFQDSALDRRVKKEPQVMDPDSGPPPPFKSPRARFEPPPRPGATFRRKWERNYSDLFNHNPPASPGRGAVPRADANQLLGSFQDTRTEVARRNGEYRPLRMRSADTALPGGKSPGRKDAASPRSPGARTRLGRGAAGRGGSGAGEVEVAVAAAEERASAAATNEVARATWEMTSPRNQHNLFDSAGQSASTSRLYSAASEARRRYEDDMAGYSSGTAAFTGFGQEQPKPRAPPRSKMTSSSPVLGLSPRGFHPRSPRARTLGDSRAGGSDDDMEMLPDKAVARERFRRQMSSDNVFRFDQGR
mmetsp:Transcript_44886/g.106511  ORF Transcript_44886/g.106511 Transcript_44886/m.106511 type:complete len:487 (-) Transcript_44886:36-1496(-)